jgi:hypothetical protein
MEKILGEFLGVVKSVSAQGMEVAKVQFPILCDQLVRYGAYSNAFYASIMLVLLISCVTAIVFSKKLTGESKAEAQFVSLLVGVASLVGLVKFISNLMYILLAPNAYLIGELTKLVK